MTTTTRMSLAEFLALPETKPYREFVAGEVIEKVAPNADHGFLTAEIIVSMGAYLREQGRYRLMNEVRHISRRESRVYLPDINVTLSERLAAVPAAERNPVPIPPDLAIEVLSPHDKPGMLADRLAFYLREGVRLVWLVDPEGRQVTVFREGGEPRTYAPPDVIDGEPVLRDFQLDLSRLFSVLDTPSS